MNMWNNVTVSNSTTTQRPLNHDVMTPMSLFVTIVSSFLCVSGFLGNGIIATIIIKTKKMQTSTNWFILNLAICDLIILSTSIPLTLIHHVNADFSFPFGRIGCKYLVMPVLEHFASVSVLTHTAISFARYTVIKRWGFRGFIRNKSVGLIVFFIWLLSFLVLSATLMGFLGYFEFGTDANGHPTCRLHWISIGHRYAYRTLVFVLTYVTPMSLTGYSYLKIHELVCNSLHMVHTLLTDSMLRNRNDKLQRMNRSLTTMYLVYATITSPLQLFLCLIDFDVLRHHSNPGTLLNVFDVLLLLFYFQILSNPFVLLYVGGEFRKEVRHLWRCAPLPNTVQRSKNKMKRRFSRMQRRNKVSCQAVYLRERCSSLCTISEETSNMERRSVTSTDTVVEYQETLF